MQHSPSAAAGSATLALSAIFHQRSANWDNNLIKETAPKKSISVDKERLPVVSFKLQSFPLSRSSCPGTLWLFYHRAANKARAKSAAATGCRLFYKQPGKKSGWNSKRRGMRPCDWWSKFELSRTIRWCEKKNVAPNLKFKGRNSATEWITVVVKFNPMMEAILGMLCSLFGLCAEWKWVLRMLSFLSEFGKKTVVKWAAGGWLKQF